MSPEPVDPPLEEQSSASEAMEVIATVSHELRSPLTSVKGYTSLLMHRWERLSDEQKMFMLEQIHHDADRVTRLVTELLDISRLETGKLTLRQERVDVVELSGSVVEKLVFDYPELDVERHFPDGFPVILADPDKVEQILTNLVENAAKYASPTGMRIDGSLDGDRIAVRVADVGEGIPAEDVPRVFERFYRSGHGKPSGTGLGLWISRGLAEAHGGSLSAASTVGEGSVFCLELPLAPATTGT